MIRKTIGALVLGTALLVSGSASAQVPRLINFQGHLRDAASGLSKTGAYSLTFAIWNSDIPNGKLCKDDAANCCFMETQPVPVNSGLFSVNIGDKTVGGISSKCDFSVKYFVEVQVGGDTIMAPRLPLAAVAYALRAQVASDSDTVGGFTATGLFSKTEYTVHASCAGAGGLSCNSQCMMNTYGPWRTGGCWNGDPVTDYRPPACPSGCSEIGNPSTFCDPVTVTDYYGTKFRYKKTCLCNNTLHGYLKVQ
ncbi:MAG TPA: hypothetical protein VGQ83_34535 [Polyangia bacterium]|jgi:hypothetical protein